MPFQLGHKLAPGGKFGNKGGTGRPPEWLRSKCQYIVDREQLVEFLGRVASGDDVDQVINQNGECLKVPASVKDRIKAVELLLDRGFGKAAETIKVGFDDKLADRLKAARIEMLKEA